MITKYQVSHVWTTDNAVCVRLLDGREACEPFTAFPLLLNATPTQRANFSLSAFGIRWNELDEDLSFDGFFADKPQPPLSPTRELFRRFPEINVSAFARRVGISQPLMASYISGAKTPSEERKQLIISELRKIGEALASATLSTTPQKP